jgi:hypothetical protein
MMPGMMGMMPMMARMTCEMTKDGMMCRVVPADGTNMEMFKERCEAMTKMMAMGMPVTMMCGHMPVMTCMTAMTK